MRYLQKTSDSQVLAQNLQYPQDRTKIQTFLRTEQLGFCAYTERYMGAKDAAVEIEHSDPRLKGTAQDSYWNWYSVSRWINLRKPRKINLFEPILCPYASDCLDRL